MSSLSDRIDALFSDWDRPDSPGCALLVADHGHTLHAKGYGMANLDYDIPITPTTVFHVASVSKHFTAMAILLLAQAGTLSLDDDIRLYLPEMAVYHETITLRHLIHHRSGLRDQWQLLSLAGWRDHDVKTNDDVLALITRQHALQYAPGTTFSYNNTGYTLLALIVERVTGMSFRAYTTSTIFEPLGMRQTHFHDDHTMIVKNRASAYVPAPSGGFKISVPAFDTVGATSLFTTAEDLACWGENFFHQQVGGEEVISAMCTPWDFHDGTHPFYACGLSIGTHREYRMVEHGGGDAGYRAKFAFFPNQHLTIVLLGNLSTINPHPLTLQVADLCLPHHPHSARSQEKPEAQKTHPSSAEPQPIPLSVDQREAYVGSYYSAELLCVYVLILKQQQLSLQRLHAEDRELLCVEADTFLVHPDLHLVFLRNEHNDVSGFDVNTTATKNIHFVKMRW